MERILKKTRITGSITIDSIGSDDDLFCDGVDLGVFEIKPIKKHLNNGLIVLIVLDNQNLRIVRFNLKDNLELEGFKLSEPSTYRTSDLTAQIIAEDLKQKNYGLLLTPIRRDGVTIHQLIKVPLYFEEE